MSFINLDLVFSAITSIANPLIKEKILRSETVIKLLQQFNLDPEHPPADFSGVYAYALVEYGVGKPKPLLELFRQEAIKQAFRTALDHNNPSILLSEVDAFLDAYTLGDDIRGLELDVRREVAEFATVFIEVAKRSRTPADVLMNQKIGSLHKRIASIQEQLERLPTLEGIRTEIARLAVNNYPALPSSVTENQCRAIALAQQMRGWFETLGYDFEKYEIWAEEYFEWIIQIPVRRSYDRVLIRGVAGEIGLSDVMALRSSVEAQKTDEGWLVTTRRISRAARDEVKKEANRHLDCFTFDELIDLDADFNAYLDWLEAEIKRRKIDTKYVPLACTKEEIDPVTKQRIGVSRYEEEDGWIDGYIDLWLDDPAKEHISILGEFGTGKTWFVFHYAWTALQRYRDAQKRGVERPRLPLVITLRDFAKALNVENVLAGFFFTQHNIRINSEVFDQLNRMGKLLLIFDGFDEMAAKVDRQQMINNFWELAKVVVPGAKVILTCRTEHFPEAKEGRALLNAELQASTKKLTGETPQFEVLELEKFNNEQIRQVLSYQAEAATVEQVMGNGQLLDLARRPVMTDLILEALPDIEAGKPVDMSRVYLYAVRRKMERDIKAERTFTSLADKLYFLCELSWEMLSSDQMSLNYRLFPERIRRLFGSSVQEEKDLDHWHYDMMAQTMLVRNADGDYTPAHRSLLEFFVAYKFAAELGALASDFTELAQARSLVDKTVVPTDYTWSGYFSQQGSGEAMPAATPLGNAPLKAFTSESLNKLRQTFGKAPLTKAVMDLLLPMLSNSESLINAIEVTRGKSENEADYVGGNAATLAVKVDKTALEDRDLSQVVVKRADFTGAILRNVNFADANLANSVFTNTLSQIFSVAFNSNGQFLAMGDGAGIRLWRITDKQQIMTFNGHQNLVYSVTFSPDDQMLVSVSSDCTVKLWDVRTGKCMQTLLGHTATVRTIAFSPNAQVIASGSEDKTAKLWDVKTGECLITFSVQDSLVRAIAFSPNGEILAFTDSNYTINLWNTRISQIQKILQGHTSYVRAITFSPNGKIIVTCSHDRTIKLWDINTGECLKTLQGHKDVVNSIACDSNGKILASGSTDRTIKLWDINTGECLTTLKEHDNWVQSVAFSPDGQTLASGSQDHSVKLWDVNTGECIYRFQGYANWLKSVVFHPNGQLIASGGQDQIVRLWDINTGKCTKELQGHNDWIRCLAFSPDGQILASGSGDFTIRLWDVQTGECTKILQEDTGKLFSIVFSPDGLKLAIASGRTIQLWDFNTKQNIYEIRAHTRSITKLSFSCDGQIIASLSYDDTVKLWDVSTGKCLKTLTGEKKKNWSRAGAFSSDIKIVATCSDDYIAKLWNIYTGQCLMTLEEHTGQIKVFAFSFDGQILATGSDDLSIKLWNVHTGKCLITLQGHTRTISSISFSPKGKVLSSCAEDGIIKIWNIETGECLKTLRSDRPYERMNITGVKGLTEAEKGTLKALGAVEDGE
ncbi:MULTISPECIES: NACHT domain-containing protein [unclassified Tolypothrix]|uniref:WD40 domain-containing protein n=1 Tax=unclassified Tolypothrix TaxID=2649714 RepID=UPI0005EAAA37|nr:MULTISPECIES: NACHT domain-containing protein [unclassified Tolypothrix]BAY94959.1 WD-40 repeat protein [Microchaete diplosiphon NIES-3275]EKE97103.1 WD domain, G-beta repeat protein [Tolypothrix sp. PCC 7601]MBE9086727.1 PD40 domain-containing protein [Tolypothrix sp. LEGE 11397]UYD28598.1 PD40 domain-containing protein [Tolypothrix sp. PCC 7712]UYD35492.1 PD40 domain-containing protein [Tolypothrix sp. PCC 7601]